MVKFLACSKNVALIAALIAVGALTRILLENVIIFTPQPFYGLLIAVGLTETLTFISGFTLGPVAGFVTGASIIVISDMATVPGPWTPFIAVIIGIIGVIAGIARRFIFQGWRWHVILTYKLHNKNILLNMKRLRHTNTYLIGFLKILKLLLSP
jgi:uncharacterized membrane protein